MVKRIYVEKKHPFDVEAQSICADLKENLFLNGLEGVRLINRYDVEGITDEEYEKARGTIFAEPNVDNVYDEDIELSGGRALCVAYLPGQYDQRADSAAQCIQLLTQKDAPTVRSAKVIYLVGQISDEEFEKAKKYLINPVESMEASMDKVETLEMELEYPSDVKIIEGFINMDKEAIRQYHDSMGMAMSVEDLDFVKEYFRSEGRDPSLTEIKVIDTYWSDHCRHTTFATKLDSIKIDEGKYSAAFNGAIEEYYAMRNECSSSKPVTLMDMATIGAKTIKKRGLLTDLDESDEINACSVVVPVDVDGKVEDYVVMFKNETHNHPTEIEPFGGAATCLGGAIRDPLSGRSYVYQAMRVTGSGDVRTAVKDTIPGKLPQRKISKGAAQGYSSYGNQIGLATGLVDEIYAPGYVAKRMEIGAVVGAAPKANIVREKLEAGDKVILLGGRTGRDGCGGATGSSKAHTVESIKVCGAEVQKGNAPTERKLQRLFRDPKASTLIKKCNDFGAGGVCVAIGELSDGLDIYLDLVRKKYEGLDGTELAISESQERMAVVVDEENVEKFIALAEAENLEAVCVATVTDTERLRMVWRGKTIVDIARSFLDTNGVTQYTNAAIAQPDENKNWFNELNGEGATETERLINVLTQLNVCAQKGLSERFDSTIGRGTVLMPFGGKHQLTPQMSMAAKIPLLRGETNTATLMSFGYIPELSVWSPFHGAIYAVIQSLAKITACGGDMSKVRMSFQEFFERMSADPYRWGKPTAALLGSVQAQNRLGIPAIGGKDSMSGSFMDMDVPPTLVAFSMGVAKASDVVSAEFKNSGSKLVWVGIKRGTDLIPDYDNVKETYKRIFNLMEKGSILACSTVEEGGVAAAAAKMCFGNMIGMKLNGTTKQLFGNDVGALIMEVGADFDEAKELGGLEYCVLGATTDDGAITLNGEKIDLALCRDRWLNVLTGVYPITAESKNASAAYNVNGAEKPVIARAKSIARPRVFIPVFPGTNCEIDTAYCFEKAGAETSTLVVNNLSPEAITESILAMEKEIKRSNIIMIPGGFSGGDEPDGSGKFIATTFRNARIRDAVMELLKNRDGLMLGICNGFQALIKLGLVPYGEIRDDIEVEAPTLTYNTIGRHMSCMVETRVASKLSPWLNGTDLGECFTIPISHGEGRFVASPEMLQSLIANGQIATQYVDLNGQATDEMPFNPNGSLCAIEGITSPDGRVFGKMGHSERIGNYVAKNVPGTKDMQLFRSGVEYFK